MLARTRQEDAVLEVQDDAGDGLEAVLRSVEIRRVQPVALGAQRQPRMDAIVHTDARLRHQGVAPAGRRLRLQVAAADQSMAPRFPSLPAPANAKATRPAKKLRRTAAGAGRAKRGDHVPFQGKPAIRKVAQRGVQADQAGVDRAGTKPHVVEAHAQL